MPLTNLTHEKVRQVLNDMFDDHIRTGLAANNVSYPPGTVEAVRAEVVKMLDMDRVVDTIRLRLSKRSPWER